MQGYGKDVTAKADSNVSIGLGSGLLDDSLM